MARKGDNNLTLSRPAAQTLVQNKTSTYGTIPGGRGFHPCLQRWDIKQARGHIKTHTQFQECLRECIGNYIDIEKKGYRTVTLSGVDHAQIVTLSVLCNCCFPIIGDDGHEFFWCWVQCGVQWLVRAGDQRRAQDWCVDAKYYPCSISTVTRGPDRLCVVALTACAALVANDNHTTLTDLTLG